MIQKKKKIDVMKEKLCLPVDLNKNCRYPRWVWRPIQEEMMLVIELELAHLVRVLDLAVDLHLHHRHHIESID